MLRLTKQSIIVRLKTIKHYLHVISDKGEHIFHASYLGLVAYEAHGNYRYAAMGLLCCIFLHAIAGGEE